MSGFPALKLQELVRALTAAGFEATRIRGSHRILKHPDGRWTTVPVHGGRDIDPNLLRKILRDISMSPGDLQQLL